MTTVVGGLRARFIHDSFVAMITDALAARSWFDSDRRHLPIVVTTQPYGWDEPIPVNTVTISGEDSVSADAELGSTASDDTWTFYIDFYAENEALGMDVAHDIRDILRGKIPSVGRGRPDLTVLDWREDPPTPLFKCQLEDIVMDRARGFTRPFERYWYAVRCDVVDENYDVEEI